MHMSRARTIVATCAVPVSVHCTNAQLPLFRGNLLSESTAFTLVNLVLSKVHVGTKLIWSMIWRRTRVHLPRPQRRPLKVPARARLRLRHLQAGAQWRSRLNGSSLSHPLTELLVNRILRASINDQWGRNMVIRTPLFGR